MFLCGDVMTGRGIDQILPHSVRPGLYEPYVRDARQYVALAEAGSGPIPRSVDPGYVWGDALEELQRAAPQARIVNLETAVTTSEEAWPRKGIHYRMHPGNVEALTVARIDCCVLANNHVLDWGYAGLAETLRTLAGASIRASGAGGDLAAASAPAVLPTPGPGRLLVFALASESSGVPRSWSAGGDRPGVHLIDDLGEGSAEAVVDLVERHKQAQDRVVVSIHWGGNWGYEIPEPQRRFAHALIDRGAADVIHGHSSHHVKGIEVYRNRLVLYGCGDFINDYEGIGGHQAYRGDLSLMYFPTLNAGEGALAELVMVPMRLHRFRLQRASAPETDWLARVLNREGRRFGTAVEADDLGRLRLLWT